MSTNLINIIFGMKVRQARTEADLTLSEFAQLCQLSPSYVTEIEKGRKYPRANKIMKIAEVLDKSYDELVSIKLAPSLTYLETTLSSSVFQKFPFEEFGFEASDLVHLLTRKPDQASALLHAVLDLTRRYGLETEDFLRAALQSYQEIHENYFPDLEKAADEFVETIGQKYGFSGGPLVGEEGNVFATILVEEYGYTIDLETIPATPSLNKFRSVLLPGKQPRLLVNPNLEQCQKTFVLAREVGYCFLGIDERPLTSTPNQIDTFEQILNYFQAAYFGGALMMPRQQILPDLERFFAQTTFNPQPMLDMMVTYDVTPEMLFYRLSELIPQFFGLKLHFLRFQHNINGGSYHLIRQLNMNRLLVPSGLGLDEHYCRRWLSVRLIREIKAGKTAVSTKQPHVGVQYSEFVESRDPFLCIGFSFPEPLNPDVITSVLLGFRVEGDMRSTIRFADDPEIPRELINETCERCPLTPDQCSVRAVPPTRLMADQQKMDLKATLVELKNKFRGK